MRAAFVDAAIRAAERDDSLYLLTGDVGFSVLESFRDKYPSRFINTGIAEENMIGIAAGLALSGKKVIVYSITNFSFLRALEYIRNDVCYHNLDVKIITSGGGLIYGPQGYTHHCIEDFAIMRSLPKIALFAPADPLEAFQVVKMAIDYKGPCYIRLGRSGEPVVHSCEPAFRIGEPLLLRKGKDLCIITTGAMLSLAIRIAEDLYKEGVFSAVLSMPCLKPINRELLKEHVTCFPKLVTIEEHYETGGLFSLLSEFIVQNDIDCRIKAFALGHEHIQVVGERDFLLDRHGISQQKVLKAVMEFLQQ